MVLLPWWFTQFRVVPGWNETIGWVLIAVGLFPLIESICRFVIVGHGSLIPTVPTEHLVMSGLYRYVRNPMYLRVAAWMA